MALYTVPGTVHAITNVTEYNSWVSKEGSLSVILFWADFHTASLPGQSIDITFTQLAMLHPKLHFYKIQAEKVSKVAELFNVSVVPTFVFTQGGVVLDKIEGGNVALVAKRVEMLHLSLENKGTKNNIKTSSAMTDRLEKLINASPVMVFMKGSPKEPNCGFSKTLVALFETNKIPFGSFDILMDEDVRAGLKIHSDWPTFPQVYVHGSLIGGLDIVSEMAEGGALVKELGIQETIDTAEHALHEKLKLLTTSSPVILFMKGSPNDPQCGFSRTIVALLRDHTVPFATFDILSDNEVRQGLKSYSNWPTFPQLYVNGALIGGLDILTEMADDGNLADQFGIAKKNTIDYEALVNQHPVMLFMKGNVTSPQCGFSRTLVDILQTEGFKFETFDILSDEKVRAGLKIFSNWPTFPQLYIKGELIGGLDIVQELQLEDELSALKP